MIEMVLDQLTSRGVVPIKSGQGMALRLGPMSTYRPVYSDVPQAVGRVAFIGVGHRYHWQAAYIPLVE